MREYRQIQFNEKPDEHGSIIVLNTPFMEAPFIRIYLDADGVFKSWEARQLPGYESFTTNVHDPLKRENIYAYRMVANSLTGYNMTAPLNQSGSVTVANLPMSLDLKSIYQNAQTANPLQYIRCLDYLPLSSAGVANITNSFLVSSATEGSYICLRHTDPHIPFSYRNSDQAKATFDVYYNDTTTGILPAQTTITNYLAWADKDDYGKYCTVGGSPIGVTYPSKMDLGITVYEGLPTTAELTFKGMAAWEFIPKMNSSKINQSVPMPPLDPVFIDALNAAELTCSSFGVASDNGFGTFIKSLVNKVTEYTPLIKKVAGVLPPQISGVVNAVADAIPKVNSVVNSLVKDNADTKKTVANMQNKLNSSLVTPSVRGMRGRR